MRGVKLAGVVQINTSEILNWVSEYVLLGGPVIAGADTAGAVTVGPVAGGGTGAGVVVGDAGARTTRVAETPRLPPPQRPVMV